MKTTVINIRDRLIDYDSGDYVYIARPSRWGNPYPITRHTSREMSIALYEARLRKMPSLLDALPELVGKRLGCYCKPLPCHGDILIKLIKERGLEK